MSRAPSAFRQIDITKALKAVRAAGYGAARVQIDRNGEIDITTMAEGEPKADTPVEQNEWDEAR